MSTHFSNALYLTSDLESESCKCVTLPKKNRGIIILEHVPTYVLIITTIESLMFLCIFVEYILKSVSQWLVSKVCETIDF